MSWPCYIITSSFTFYGFVPNTKKDRKELFNEIKYSKVKTKVLYESPKRVLDLLNDISVYMPGSVVCICAELTKIHERCIYGKIEDVLEKMKKNSKELLGEFVILISNEVKQKDDNNMSLESLIVNEMIKNKCSIKDAIKKLNEENENISKKDIYNASLNLKKVLDKNQL